MPTQHLKYHQSNPVRYEIEMQILLLRSASGCLIGWTVLSLSAISVLLHFSSVGIFALITQSIHNLASLQEILKYFQPPKTQSWSDQQITVVHYWDTLPVGITHSFYLSRQFSFHQDTFSWLWQYSVSWYQTRVGKGLGMHSCPDTTALTVTILTPTSWEFSDLACQ